MEPFLTSLVGALAAGAVAAAKDTVGQAVKDAYQAVRRYIKDRYTAVHLEELDKEPQSKDRRVEFEQKFQKAGAMDDPALPKLVADLLSAIQEHAPQAAGMVGVDLGDLHAAAGVQLRRVGEGGPVRVRDINAGTGSIIIEDVGGTSKK
jgi:hypothetical protein